MLRLHTPTGSIEALPHQEARVRGLSNAALLRELERTDNLDPFAVAEAIGRALIVFNPVRGCYVARPVHH